MFTARYELHLLLKFRLIFISELLILLPRSDESSGKKVYIVYTGAQTSEKFFQAIGFTEHQTIFSQT